MDKGPGNPSSNKIINYDERKVVQGRDSRIVTYKPQNKTTK